jgi:DNA-binding transcriptional ArsR family regulator
MTAESSLDCLLHAIADPTRRRILRSLRARRPSSPGHPHGLCARDLEERIHVSQPTISHHMAILERAGLVETRKQAQWRWYCRNEPAIRHFIETMKKAL